MDPIIEMNYVQCQRTKQTRESLSKSKKKLGKDKTPQK